MHATVIHILTRWSSTYDMLRRLCYLWPAIKAAAAHNHDLKQHLPTKKEMKLAKELVSALKPFAKVHRIVQIVCLAVIGRLSQP